nr:hypothetical protein [Tanacetum cinerariifolium]
MSDSEDSTVTYTIVSSPYEGRSRDVSPGVDQPPVIPEDPYAYVSDPDEDPKEDDDEDPEEDPADYPADHDDDDNEEEPSGDDADEEDEEQDKDDDDEEEEHPASADSIPSPPALRRLSIVHYPRYEAGESSVAAAARPIKGRKADYGFVDCVEAEIRQRRAKDIGYGIRDT